MIKPCNLGYKYRLYPTREQRTHLKVTSYDAVVRRTLKLIDSEVVHT
jgi:hypothetical protein